MNFDISFENWKALTALLTDENDTYDNVISRLLPKKTLFALASTSIKPAIGYASTTNDTDNSGGAYYKNVFLPNGTDIRADYKGETYFSKISDRKWIDCKTGEERTSPSQAAYSITGSGVNGWLFWLVKRPQDSQWISLDSLRSGRKL
jgi:hypothetical protein